MTNKQKSVTKKKDTGAVDSFSDLPETVGIISMDKFKEKLAALEAQEVIRDESGKDVPFAGETKTDFIEAMKSGYQVAQMTVTTMYEAGKIISEVNQRLKPKKLYMVWLEHVGLPQRTAHNYMQVYKRYGEKLADLAHLGIRKLLIASRLKDCADYVEQNQTTIADNTSVELEEMVRSMLPAKGGQKSKTSASKSCIEIGNYRIKPSSGGKSITVEGLTKEQQSELIEALKKILSEAK